MEYLLVLIFGRSSVKVPPESGNWFTFYSTLEGAICSIKQLARCAIKRADYQKKVLRRAQTTKQAISPQIKTYLHRLLYG